MISIKEMQINIKEAWNVFETFENVTGIWNWITHSEYFCRGWLWKREQPFRCVVIKGFSEKLRIILRKTSKTILSLVKLQAWSFQFTKRNPVCTMFSQNLRKLFRELLPAYPMGTLSKVDVHKMSNTSYKYLFLFSLACLSTGKKMQIPNKLRYMLKCQIVTARSCGCVKVLPPATRIVAHTFTYVWKWSLFACYLHA